MTQFDRLNATSGLFPIQLMKPDLDRLTAARGSAESYSDVILRLAKLEAKIRANQ